MPKKVQELMEIIKKWPLARKKEFLEKIKASKTASASLEKKLTQMDHEDSTIKGSGEPLYFAKLPSGCLCGGPVTPYFPSTVNTPAEREAYLALNYTCDTEAGNNRVRQMQESRVDFQKVMNQEQDPNS